jgi:hypothetical protein
VEITGKSQNTLYLTVGMDGKRGMEVATPYKVFSLEATLQLAAGLFTLPAPGS